MLFGLILVENDRILPSSLTAKFVASGGNPWYESAVSHDAHCHCDVIRVYAARGDTTQRHCVLVWTNQHHGHGELI